MKRYTYTPNPWSAKSGANMADRELLEKAAKAVGYVVFDCRYEDGGLLCHDGSNPVRFSPLTDDGDALRLAVKLGIFVQVLPNESRALLDDWVYELHGADHYAATSRAIVREAAAIGEQTP